MGNTIQMGRSALSSSQTAEYTGELLDSLKEMAAVQRHEMLARLLEAASIEAHRIVKKETSPAR
ncbi:MAG TPA: hypothetical protein VIJ85_05095 [Rhizomicrobium sp.]